MKRKSKLLVFAGIAAGIAVGIVALQFLSNHHASTMVHPDTKIDGIGTKLNSQSSTGNAPASSEQGLGVVATKGKESTTPNSAHWGTKFGASKDYFDFVRMAASAASEGDGRAAFYVKEALGECADIMVLSKRVADPESAFEKSVDHPYTPAWSRDAQLSRFRKCIHLAQEDAFAALPDRQGGYPLDYWKQLALEYRDPVAEAYQALEAYVNLPQINSASKRTESLDRINAYIKGAVSSKDPEAIFAIGTSVAFGSFQKDPSRGFAMALAACDLGMDCTTKNPQQRFWENCVAASKCGPNTTFPEFLQMTVDAESYGRIYMLAQEFKDSLSRNDWSDLKKYTSLTNMQ
jgi:hypothetical protein